MRRLDWSLSATILEGSIRKGSHTSLKEIDTSEIKIGRTIS